MVTRPVARRLLRKELGLFFGSPVAWLFLAAFAGACLFIVFWAESFFARNIADVRPLFEWMPVLLIFLCSAITMRTWSEERRSGTLEHVLVQPSALWRFALGKFYACEFLLLLALAATAPLPLTVAAIADLDWGPVLAGYLASALLGAAYISIGLFVSARTDNAIVSLIGSVALCGALYLLGSGLFTGFFSAEGAETLRRLGSGSRFASITRGVIDVRDLVYYLSLSCGFLGLSIYSLEREGWARLATTPRQRHWRLGILLLLANLLAANLWLDRVANLRIDVTQGRLYSISDASRELVTHLREPLLIRGYFSARNHPLLAPLEPQLKDLIQEYASAGRGNVRVEFVDPAQDPELEQEANERYGIKATPIQVADRYQTALVNAYFHVLVQYVSEYKVLSFAELIEMRTAASGQPEVQLRNPEYDITRAIRDVLYNYRAGGDLFAGIDEPVEFIGYVSSPAQLPDELLAYREAIEDPLRRAAEASGGKFSYRFLPPEQGNGELAQRIEQDWGFAPMRDPLDEERSFFFYLTLADSQQVVRLPTGEFDPDDFRQVLDAGLKRFAHNFTRSVALSAPRVTPEVARQGLGGPAFNTLQETITRDHSLLLEDLADGTVSPEADVLVVIAPQQLGETAIFALDQFLMRGGTVILATSPWSVQPDDSGLDMQRRRNGLKAWLKHLGVSIGDSLVLDKRHANFPAPVRRVTGDYEFRDVQIVGYPYFIDIREDGLADHPVSRNLPQVTMAWASPLRIEPPAGVRLTRLLTSSREAWASDERDITPQQDSSWPAPEQTRRELLGASLQGRFSSFFSQPPAALAQLPGTTAAAHGFVRHSPESARLIVYPSNDFLSDRVLGAQVRASGNQYLGPIQLFNNTLDWALQEERFLQIRARAHFNRTLPPMEQRMRLALELANYGAAVGWLALIGIVAWLMRRWRRAWFRRELGL
ncbi:ABC transporter permease [Mangrovimicrobium sediminis]|uniref:ABC transporter permease n=1 Tax=Mangrovimicrobium sediminis TaxID=2562682 RepID=A0A4Z0M928_9GAMM|nr:ABC transporter permease [Haliea sp. SAOS-164]